MSNQLLVCICTVAFVIGGARSAAVMNMPQISKMEVQCAKSGMTVDVEFDQPFDGIIFSKGHFSDPACRFVRGSSGGATAYRFRVPGDGCGTESVAGKLNLGYQNVLVIQTEGTVIQDIGRHTSQRILCVFNPQNKTHLVAFQPVLNVTDTAADKLHHEDIRASILTGDGLDGPPVNPDAPLKIGDPLTLVFALHSNQDFSDMFVKNCFASDGTTYRVRLTDDNGCPNRPKLMRAFTRKGNTAFASLTTFKIAEKMTLHLACEVELCRETCRNSTDAICAESSPTISSTPKPSTTTTSRPNYPIQVPLTTTTTTTTSTSTPTVYPTLAPGYYVVVTPSPPHPVRPTYSSSILCQPGYYHPKCPYRPADPCHGRYKHDCPPRRYNPVVRWKAAGHQPISSSPLKKSTGR